MAASEYRAAAEAILRLSRERAKKLDEIRRALLQGDDAQALRLMRIYTGTDQEPGDEESDRTGQSLH